MTDANSPSSGPAGEAAESSAPPLRAAFLVWPGKAHGQTWVLLWLSFIYLFGGLLPWQGENQVKVVVDRPVNVLNQGERQEMTRVEFDIAMAGMKARGETELPRIVQVRDDRSMGLGRFLILLGGLAMVITSFTNIWTRRLNVTPTLLTWFEALLIIYFARSTAAVAVGEGQLGLETVGGMAQIGTMFGSGLGSVGDVFGGTGDVTAETRASLAPFGLGFYLTCIAQIGTLLLILAGIFFSGKKGGGSEGGAGKGSSGGANRPGRRPMPGRPAAPESGVEG